MNDLYSMEGTKSNIINNQGLTPLLCVNLPFDQIDEKIDGVKEPTSTITSKDQPYLTKNMLENRITAVERIEILPRTAIHEKKYLKQQSVKSYTLNRVFEDIGTYRSIEQTATNPV